MTNQEAKEVAEAISRSVSHDEIVTLTPESFEHDSALREALALAADDYTLGNDVWEFWAYDEPGDPGDAMAWRVHLVRYDRIAEDAEYAMAD